MPVRDSFWLLKLLQNIDNIILFVNKKLWEDIQKKRNKANKAIKNRIHKFSHL